MEKNLLLTSEDVMNLIGFNKPSLAHHIREGNLRVYALSGEPPVAPEDLRGTVRSGPNGWTFIEKGTIEGVTTNNITKMPLGQITHLLPNCIFTRDDVIEFAGKHGFNMKNQVEFDHSPTYSEVWKNGKEYHLTPMQAESIKLLHEAHMEGKPTINQAKILEEIGSSAPNLRKVFKGNTETFEDLILKVGGGRYRLNI